MVLAWGCGEDGEGSDCGKVVAFEVNGGGGRRFGVDTFPAGGERSAASGMS